MKIGVWPTISKFFDTLSQKSIVLHLRLQYLWCRVISVGKPGYFFALTFFHLLFTFLSLLYSFFKFNAHYSCSIALIKAGLNLLINNNLIQLLYAFFSLLCYFFKFKAHFFCSIVIINAGLKLLFNKRFKKAGKRRYLLLTY